MITLTVIGMAVLTLYVIVAMIRLCWWFGIILAIIGAGVWIDYLVIKGGFTKLFGKKEKR